MPLIRDKIFDRHVSLAAALAALVLAVAPGCGSDSSTSRDDSPPEDADTSKSDAHVDSGHAHAQDAAHADAAQAGEGGQAQPDAGPVAKFSEIYPMIFPSMTNPRCNFCHSMPASEASNGKLSMGSDPSTAYAALVGKSSGSGMCMGKPLVVPNQPDMSLFLQKLSENPPCGSRMPVGGMPLSTQQLAMIRSWIAAGAKND